MADDPTKTVTLRDRAAARVGNRFSQALQAMLKEVRETGRIRDIRAY